MPSPSLLQRLKERKLVQWALAYLAGAFVVFQVLDALETALGLTATMQQAILVLAVIGFFVTLILAWYHGEKGRQGVSGPELLMVAALLAVAGVALSMLGGTGPTSRMPGSRVGGAESPALIILTCDNISPRPEDAYLADGIHSEILLRLAGVSGVFLLGRESAKWYRENPTPPDQIAAERNLDFIGECSVRKDPNADRILVTFQLLNADGGQEWSDEYAGDFATADLFDIQRDIAQRVAQRIGAVLTAEERKRIEAVPTANVEAYDLYLRGSYHLKEMTVEDAHKAIECFEEAIGIDSAYAAPHAGLATAWNLLAQPLAEVPTGEGMAKAKTAAERALALAPDFAEAHSILGLVVATHDWDWQKAERLIQRAIDLDPSSSQAHMSYAVYLEMVGRHEESVAEGTRAVELDPLSLFQRAGLAEFYYFARQHDRALEEARKVLDMDADYDRARAVMMWVYEELGMCREYLSLRRERLMGPGAQPEALAGQATLEQACIDSGFVDIWRSRLERNLERVTAGEHVRPMAIAGDYSKLGRVNQAFEWVERAYEERDGELAFIKTEPGYDRLRSDPRVQALMRRMNFPE